MKNLSILLVFGLSLIFISCTKEDIVDDSRNCTEVAYDETFEIQLTDEICFPDGNTLTLTDVQHQFCPCEVVCVTAGDLFISLTTATGTDTQVKEIYPETLDSDRDIFENHTITSLTYIYGDQNEDIPRCAEDFEASKITLMLSISTN